MSLSSSLVLRQAKMVDVPFLIKIREDAKLKNYSKFLNKNFYISRPTKVTKISLGDIIDNSDYYIKVAEKDKEILGWIKFKKSERYIKDLYVSINHQGEGIGSLLIQDVIHKFGNEKIALSVLKFNKNAIEFYKKNQFQIAGEITPLNYKNFRFERYRMERLPNQMQ